MKHGMGVQVGVGWYLPWLGAATPLIGMGHVSEHVSTMGGTWKGWMGVVSILSPLPGHSPEHVPEEGVGCGTMVLAHPGRHYYAKIHRGRGGLWDP